MKRMIELACQSQHSVGVLEWSAIQKISTYENHPYLSMGSSVNDVRGWEVA